MAFLHLSSFVSVKLKYVWQKSKGSLLFFKRRVPDDISVVGFDDIPGAGFYNPPLTTVHQHLEMQGSIGAEIIRALIHARHSNEAIKPIHRRVVPRLVVRQSTAAPPATAGIPA